MRRPTRLVFFLLILSLPYTLLAQKPVPVQDRTFGLAPEKSTVQGPDGRHDARTGSPLALYQPNYRVGNGTPEANAREYLAARAGQLGLSSADLANLELVFLRQGPAGTTVRLAQRYEGLPVHDGEIAVSYTPTGEVHYVHNDFQFGSSVPDVRPAISVSAAKDLAYRYLRLAATISRSSEELVILPRAEGARLAYRIAVSAVTPAGDWEVFIDAKNGEVLRAQDIAVYFHDHDHSEPPSYTPAPMLVSGTGNVFDPDPLSSSGSVYGATGLVDGNDANTPQLLAQQRNVVLLDITQQGGTYSLKGPWAEVVDIEAPFKGLFSQSSPNWTANRTDDAFEAVSVYYHIDASMRYLNETLGVTVRPLGYTTGVKVDPSGFNGADNSYYSGGCECLVFGEGGVDDAEDSDVVHHELGHGLHDWITGGNLSNTQGLSEGSGDYWAVSYNRSITAFAPSHPSYNFVFNWDGHNPFWPGRRTDDTRIYSSSLPTNSNIPFNGQIWATAMIQVLDAIGKPLADRVFWEGIALTGSSSNQNDAAVAVFNASGALGYNNTTRQTIHNILTARGYILPPFVALPVEWLSVSAAPRDKTIVVSWATAAEPDNAFFTVEKSVDGGRSFQALANVPSQTSGSYAYPDLAPQAGSNTYRIRQTDHDGTFSFSQVVNVQWSVGQDWLIYPNPVAEELFVQWPSVAPGQEARLRLYDLNGKLLREWTAVEGQQRLPVNDLAPGVYLLESERGTQRFVKQ